MDHVIGIGHSHLHAISRAFIEVSAASGGKLRYTPICLLDEPFDEPIQNAEGHWVLGHPVEVTIARALKSGDRVSIFMAVGGSEAFRWSLSPGAQPFDFVDPYEDDGTPLVGEIIPYGLMERFCLDQLRFIIRFADYLRSITSLPLVQITPPPPVVPLAQIVAKQPEWFERLDGYGISPLPFRMKVWRLVCRTIANLCAEASLRWEPCPPEALELGGGLNRHMEDDAIHANVVWGRMFARRLMKQWEMAVE